MAPAACQLRSRLYLFLRVFLQRRQVVEGPCLWRMEEGNVHSNILSGAYSLSVSLASISGSGWIWCGEDAAAPISDVLLVLPLSFYIQHGKDMLQITGGGGDEKHPRRVYELRAENNSRWSCERFKILSIWEKKH